MDGLIGQLRDLLHEHDKLVGSHSDFSHYQGWPLDAGVLLLVNISLWMLSVVVGKCWPVDFIWSTFPGFMAGFILFRSPLKFISPKQWLYLAVLCFWGIRLTSNFVMRGGIGHEDWRYQDMRRLVGPRLFPIASLPMVFLGQSTFLFAGCIPLYGALRNSFSTFTLQDLIGLIMMVGAVVIETASDEQLDEFIKNRKSRAEIIDTGLWAWSRHPNYFGELTFWWGVWVAGGQELGPAIAGPLLMTMLFVLISIPLMEEKNVENKGDAYVNYIRRVPRLVPMPPGLVRMLYNIPPRHSEGGGSNANQQKSDAPEETKPSKKKKQSKKDT